MASLETLLQKNCDCSDVGLVCVGWSKLHVKAMPVSRLCLFGVKRHNVFPQQPARLGVLPIKLRGGLGGRPKPRTRFRKVPRGSAYRFHC